MKILYGVQGTGNGHINRARILQKELQKFDNVEITFLFSGRNPEHYFDMEEFGNCLYRTGVTFIVDNGRIDYIKSLFNLCPLQFIKDLKLDVSDYDLIITDYEPITAWIGKLNNKRTIGLSNQYSDDKLFHDIFAPTKERIGLSWKQQLNCLPPFKIHQQTNIELNNSILIYLPFEHINKIIDICSKFKTTNFIVYHPTEVLTKINNITFKTLSSSFKSDLLKCKGVICNSGFELISECIQVGKNILNKPLTGQFEQLENAVILEELGYAEYMETLDETIIHEWLRSNKTTKVIYPNVQQLVADYIINGTILDYKQIWSEVTHESI